jgi:hypothetical protein
MRTLLVRDELTSEYGARELSEMKLEKEYKFFMKEEDPPRRGVDNNWFYIDWVGI